MNKSTLISLVILVVLAAVGGYFYFNSSNTTLTTDARNFAVKDTASVTTIYMADKKNNEIKLVRQPSGKWTVNGKFEARQDVIDNLLTTIKMITVKAPVSKNAIENVLKNMASDGTKVEIYQNNSSTPSKVYYLGTADQFHSGSYMLVEGAEVPFLMHIEGFYGFLNPRYVLFEDDYRKNVVYHNKPQSIAALSVQYPMAPENSFGIHHTEGGQFQLMNSQSQPLLGFDSLKVKDYLNRFQKVNFETVNTGKSDQYLDSLVTHATPDFIIALKDTAENVREIRGFKRPISEGHTDLWGDSIDYDMDRMYGLINDKEIVLIQYHVFDPLTVPLGYFRKEGE